MDIRNIPFSRRGSYMAISDCCENYRGHGNPAGLWLRTVSGAAETPFVMRLQLLERGQPASFTTEFDGLTLHLVGAHGNVSLCFCGPDTLLCHGIGADIGLLLDEICAPGNCNYLQPIVPGVEDILCVNCYKNSARYLLFRSAGTMTPHQIWDREEAHDCRVEFGAAAGEFRFAIREFVRKLDLTAPPADAAPYLAAAREDLARFLPEAASIPAACRTAAKTSAYVRWASLVAPRGQLRREAMLMSKNWMTSVWSWDHCFNALALCDVDPALAWDQFLVPFDLQSPDGGLPDFVDDAACFFNCVKPPIHGWTLKKMLHRMELTLQQKQTVYEKLSAMTRWWFAQRDRDGDGLCEYWHGNDSGWDNSTVFAQGPCVISPDLSAFLVVQMDVLNTLAVQFGRDDEAAQWREQAQKTADAMVKILFENDLPIARDAMTRKIIPNESLLSYMSLLAADYLPRRCVDAMLAVLQSNDFLTPYGYATEKVASPAFEENGYWRGAVWAPTMCLLYDALKTAGADEAARTAAEAYCRAVQVGGPAENHSALTGAALRDPAYTWSASVFRLLLQEILQ